MKKLFQYLLLSIVFVGCKDKEEKKQTSITQEDLLSVTTQPVLAISQNEPISVSGMLASDSEVKLAFKTGGLIKKIYVKEGQFVKTGQLLAELDLEEINAQVNQANVGLTKAKRDLERVQRLYADSAATLQQLQDVTSAYEAASEGIKVASFNQKLSKIYAPSSGKILRKIAEQGELITPFAPAFIMGSGGAATKLKVGVSDKDVVRIHQGFPATVYIDAYPNATFKATVTQIAQTVNPTTGTFDIELNVQPNGKNLISGFVAKAEINPPSAISTLAVPIESIVEADGSEGFVYLYNATNQTVIKRKITLGSIVGSKIAVVNGLTAADEVVVLGANFLTDGEKVKRVEK